MNIEVLPMDKLEPYMKFVELKRELQVRLQIMLEEKEMQLKRMEIIKTICEHIRDLRQVHHFKLEMDVAKEVNKYVHKF